jgi:RimJ/RimL family protein N-acetyltransferase
VTSDFELQPTLRGDTVALRPLRPEDYDALYAAASDPLIWEQHPDRKRYRPEIFREYFQSGIDSGGAFAIVDLASGHIIGSSRYWNYKPPQNGSDSEIEIGWTFLERKFWGGKCNREIKQLMLRHAFRFVERVVLIVGEHNLRSQRAVERIGGRLERREPRPGSDGVQRWNVVYVITREEFEHSPLCSSEGEQSSSTHGASED